MLNDAINLNILLTFFKNEQFLLDPGSWTGQDPRSGLDRIQDCGLDRIQDCGLDPGPDPELDLGLAWIRSRTLDWTGPWTGLHWTGLD